MEITILLAILIFVIILLNKSNSNSRSTQDAIKNLETKIEALKEKLNSPIIKKEEIISPLKQEIKIPEEVKPLILEKPIVQEKAATSISFQNITQEVKGKPTLSPQPKVVLPPKKSRVENFKEKNPDIEKFIGENLINKLGILILVLGISFFVKFAIDKNWINEPARVGIGVLCGALVMALAQKLKKNYKAFSSVFVAGAISIFYFTIGIAFHDYHLFSQTVAFIIMVVITIFSVFVSISYDRKELAVLSLIGGFAVPFMISAGEGNYKILFAYIAILNIGMLLVAYFKKWNLVTLLAFVFTCLLYSAWFGDLVYSNKLPFRGALFFATLFYLIFSFATVVHNLRKKGTFSKLEYFIIVINTFFYFGIGISIIQLWNINFKGIFTISLALYNLIYAIVLYKKFGLQKNAIYLLLGLTLTFVTLAIPIQFNGNYITLFWAAEAVLLLWFAQKSKIETFKIGAFIVQVLMLISLFMDWNLYYFSYGKIGLNFFSNRIFITGLVALISLVSTYFLLKKENESVAIFKFTFDPKIYRKAVLILSICVGYFVGIFEVSYQANAFVSNYYSSLSYSVLYHFLFSVGLIYFGLKKKNKTFSSAFLLLSSINILLFIAKYYKMTSNEMVENFSQNLSGKSAYLTHYILLICLVYFAYVLVRFKNEVNFSHLLNHKLALWIFAFCGIYILSNELIIHGLIFSNDIVSRADLVKKFPVVKGDEYLYSYEKENFVNDRFLLVKTQIIKIAYPILWGVLSFGFLIIGIKKQNKQLRIIALSLLGITIVKLFFYDIENSSETGKIIAFILLGVLILIISFVYQKIKKLVVDEQKKTNDAENI